MENRDQQNLEQANQQFEERKAAYERKQKEMAERCKKCMATQNPSYERCVYDCTTGKRLRWLEAEYGDVTGWRHEHWKQ